MRYSIFTLIVSLCCVLPGSAEEGRIPIFEPVTLDGTLGPISGNYVVTRDITVTTADPVITIIGNGLDQNIEIDLNGFSLTGSATGPSVIDVSGLASFTLRNGSVINPRTSTDTIDIVGTADAEDRVLVEDVKIKGGDEGLSLDGVSNAVVRRNLIVGLTGSGIRIDETNGGTDPKTGLIEENVIRDTDIGIEIRTSNKSLTVRNNQVLNEAIAGLIGIRARFARSLIISGNNIAGGGNGIEIGSSSLGGGSGCDECLIADNTVSDAATSGIQLFDTDESVIRGNVVNSNDEYGIDLEESDRNFIDYNQLNRNKRFGIYLRADSVGNAYGRNTLRDNNPSPEPAAVCNVPVGVPGSPCASPAVCDETALDSTSAAPADKEANRSFEDNVDDTPGRC